MVQAPLVAVQAEPSPGALDAVKGITFSSTTDYCPREGGSLEPARRLVEGWGAWLGVALPLCMRGSASHETPVK